MDRATIVGRLEYCIGFLLEGEWYDMEWTDAEFVATIPYNIEGPVEPPRKRTPEGVERVVMVLVADYTPNGVPMDALKENMERSFTNAIGDGALTGETAAEVDSWGLDVTYIK